MPKKHGKKRWAENKPWSSSETSEPYHNKPPPGLRGKEIGMYYRSLSLQKKANGIEEKRETIVNLKIPKPLIEKLKNLLDSIGNPLTSNTQDIDIKLVGKTDDIRCLESKTKKKIITGEGQSALSEIQIDSSLKGNDPEDTEAKGLEAPVNFKTPEQITNWNLPSYKYAYEDIINTTFEQKLLDNLNKSSCIESNDELNAELLQEMEYKMMSNKYLEMLKFREKLPAYKVRTEILKLLKENQVIVISGETGCGKSTQVPQIILDEAIQSCMGAQTKILVTQPRRIAASSLALRVSEERDEQLGKSVGYAVRLESTIPRQHGSILYCTTGVLLVELEMKQSLMEYSHIILDEVHERDIHVDLSMTLLKMILEKRKDLKVILMSATLDAVALSSFFGDCPKLHIEGITYPIKEYYMEDILQEINFSLPRENNPKKRIGRTNAGEKQMQYQVSIGPWLFSKKSQLKPAVFQTLKDYRIEDINLELIVQLLKHISMKEEGGVLIFLPGISQISALYKMLKESPFFSRDKFDIYTLHSQLASLEQRKIFQRPQSGVRKVIIATNIAETSITVDDIVFVIDSGKVKMKGLTEDANSSTLDIEWVAQSNLRQRRGRAGRVQPGFCYHLMTTWRAEQLPVRHQPELQRADLIETVLTVKRLRLGDTASALAKTPDPPSESSVANAVDKLRKLGALDEEEKLTPLGWHLARLPVHPAAGKLLLFGALFGCLERAACIAAVWGFKDPFVIPLESQKRADAIRRDFARGEPSDHVAISEALLSWESTPNRSQFAWEHFLSNNNCSLLSEMKNHFTKNLREMGFLNEESTLEGSWENRNSDNISLFKAIVAAALFPNVAMVNWRRTRKGYRFSVRSADGKIPLKLHPTSVMGSHEVARLGEPGSKWVVYKLMQRTVRTFLLENTFIYTLPLLFFSNDLKYTEVPDDPEQCFLHILNIKVKCAKTTGSLLIQLRSLLDRVLASEVRGKGGDERFSKTVISAVIALITAEDEQLDSYDFESDSESDTSSCGRQSTSNDYFSSNQFGGGSSKK